MSIKSDRMQELVDDDVDTRERVRTAHRLRVAGKITSTEYVAFRRQARTALRANHEEFMALAYPKVERKVTPVRCGDLFDFDLAPLPTDGE